MHLGSNPTFSAEIRQLCHVPTLPLIVAFVSAVDRLISPGAACNVLERASFRIVSPPALAHSATGCDRHAGPGTCADRRADRSRAAA